MILYVGICDQDGFTRLDFGKCSVLQEICTYMIIYSIPPLGELLYFQRTYNLSAQNLCLA